MVAPLSPHPAFARGAGPVVLCIMDGVGFGGGGPDDAVARAHTPTLDRWLGTCPWTALSAHGTHVGLPSDEDMGNSEVGHNAIGAGRVFDQGAKLVDQAIETGSAWSSDVWRALVAGRTLHLLGLISDGNVHSHIDHVVAIVRRAAVDGVQRLRLHVLTDGRDVERRSALRYVPRLEALCAELSTGGRDFRIGSGGGRMHITMDRYEADWSMVERGWRCHVRGEGRPFPSASAAIEALYAEDPEIDDQWLPAFVVADARGPVGRIEDGDAVLMLNFRGDRAVEISQAFEDDDFTAFDRGDRPDVTYAGMMQYDGDKLIPKHYLVAPPAIAATVGEYLVTAGLRTFACSETHKFGHVTYFFNGNRTGAFDDRLETYEEVRSTTRPLQERPWMEAAEITDAVVAAITSGEFDHVRLNYANGDMVGHTGDLDATIVAVEAVDVQLARLERAVRTAGGVLLVTADHGNADEMWMRKGGAIVRGDDGRPAPRTAHSLAQVPFIVVDPLRRLVVDRRPAGIAAIGATLLELCGLAPPDDYVPGLVRPR